MPKEDRSDWVAVAPEFAAATASEPKIKPAVSAFNFYQRDFSEQVKAEYMATHDKFQVGEFSKLLRDKWKTLDDEQKAHYEDLAARDRMRFASESHVADVAAIERRERLRKQRETLLLDDEGGAQRSTRRRQAKKERQRERKEQKKAARQLNADDEEFIDEDEDESSGSYSEESDSDEGKTPKKKPPPRELTQKQIEVREKRQREKQEMETIISERQEDVRKEKAQQAKRRLEFLLKQSNIFSHFGQVKQDQARFGPSLAKQEGRSRRESVEDCKHDDDDLEEADTHQATFLISQPTTLGFGKMRQYQLEGLNWMIRLQENGVNGILADEVRTVH
jgi:SWI/SNF-related matrix-associated actin-dependent regulator of chromatin subfamily A member 5